MKAGRITVGEDPLPRHSLQQVLDLIDFNFGELCNPTRSPGEHKAYLSVLQVAMAALNHRVEEKLSR